MTEPVQGMPATRSYKEADLRPIAKDPQCDPEFPLANYWPVYFGNFWCSPYADHVRKIQQYFGSKGLLVRMIFGRNEKDDPYLVEQRRINCYDFLVYFVSQQDAQDAATYCHREKYYGHRLNVLSGRTPELFDESKSTNQVLLHPKKVEIGEEVFERLALEKFRAKINCIVKHSYRDVLVEYCSTSYRTVAIRYCKFAIPKLIPANQAKQRFLERDVQKELTAYITEKPSFMYMLPPDDVLQPLLKGSVPNCDMAWKTVQKVPQISKVGIYEVDRTLSRFQRGLVFKEAKKNFGVEVDKKHQDSALVRGAIKRGKEKRKQRSQEKQRAANVGGEYLCF